MAFVRVGSAADVWPGGVILATVGTTDVAVWDRQGKLYAVDNRCPHLGGPLAMGALQDNMLVCPWHGWEFDFTTGKCDFNQAIVLRTYEVAVVNDDILLELP